VWSNPASGSFCRKKLSQLLLWRNEAKKVQLLL
jgi:hypothetical protein